MKKTVKEVTSSFFQHGLFHNLSLTHYSGPGPDDLLFLQVEKHERGTKQWDLVTKLELKDESSNGISRCGLGKEGGG